MKPDPCGSKGACTLVSGALDRFMTHLPWSIVSVVSLVVVAVVVVLDVTTVIGLLSFLCAPMPVWF